MEGKNKKIVIGILIGVIVILLTLVILFATGVFKTSSKKNEKNNDSTTTTSTTTTTTTTVVNNVDNNQNNNQVVNTINIDPNNYLGTWYESEESAFDINANNMAIHSISNEKIVFDFYVKRTALFKNVEVKLVNGEGSFDVLSETGNPKDGNEPRATGKVKINSNNIVITIESTNIMYMDPKTYTLNFRNDGTKQIGMAPEKYVGTWYESEETAKDLNSNSIEIVSIEGENIKFGFYISRTAQFKDIEVYTASTRSSSFEAEAIMGPTEDGSKGKVKGQIRVTFDSIILTIESSNIIDLKNQTYTFKYRKS